MSEWSKWGECVNGRQRRTRRVITWNEHEGQPCGNTDEQRDCVDCEVTDWSQWSDCIGGEQERTKMVKEESEDEQKACAEMKEVRLCSTTSGEEPTESKLPLYLAIGAIAVVAWNMVG